MYRLARLLLICVPLIIGCQTGSIPFNKSEERRLELESLRNRHNLPQGFGDLVEFLSGLDKLAILLESQISNGFVLITDTDNSRLKNFSENPNFVDAFIPFSQADGTGSFYAFWVSEKNFNENQYPIVVFGSEGGIHLVASHFNSFLEIPAFDSEVSVDVRKAYYYKDSSNKYYRESVYSSKFHFWLTEYLGISKVREPNVIQEDAEYAYGVKFKDWLTENR